jgi:hypothetical protein
MSKESVSSYTQCSLERQLDLHTYRQVCWLPKQYADLDGPLEIKNSKGDWENGWRVVERYDTLEASYVEAHRNDWKYARSATDI